MSDITATRDLAVIGIVLYAVWKLRKPFSDVSGAVGEAVEQAKQTFIFYGSGGELKKAIDESQVGQTDTELTQDVIDTWTKMFQDALGDDAPPVPEPPTAHNALTGEGMQETVQILPLPVSQFTPELTPDIEHMLFAPAPNRPSPTIFPDMSPPRQTVIPEPIIQPIVPSVLDLVTQPQQSSGGSSGGGSSRGSIWGHAPTNFRTIPANPPTDSLGQGMSIAPSLREQPTFSGGRVGFLP